ncbi:hypothetical protein ACLOAV_010428 [Pseudogymnoascus australis]
MEIEPVGLESLDVALKNFIDTIRDNIANSIEAWSVLHETYEKLNKGHKEPFTSWCLRKIDHALIQTVSQMKHRAKFEALSTDGAHQLLRIADAFDTDKWMVYFVIGEAINKSPKAIRRILQVKHDLSHLTFEEMVQELETAREQRRGNNSRNSSNDLTIFTLSDVNRAYGKRPVRNRPAAPKKPKQYGRIANVNLPMTPIRPRGNPTPPGTDSSISGSDNDSDNDNDVDIHSDVEQPRETATPLPDNSFNWDDISGIAQPGMPQNARWRLQGPSADYGETQSDSTSDSTEELMPTAEPGAQNNVRDDLSRQNATVSAAQGSYCDNHNESACLVPSVKPRRLYFNHQEMQHKRQRTSGRPANDTIEISPPMIVEAIISARELAWLRPPLLELFPPDLQQPDPVDRNLWGLFQKCISPPTSSAIPIDIIKSLGFPGVEDILKMLNSDASEASELHPFLQKASEEYAARYVTAAERAAMSARLLRELIRRTTCHIQSLQMAYDNRVIDRRKVEQSKAIERIQDAAHAKADVFIQQEMALIVRVLEELFEHVQDMVTGLENIGELIHL